MRKQTFTVNILWIAVCEIHKNFQLYMSPSSRDMIACMLSLMGIPSGDVPIAPLHAWWIWPQVQFWLHSVNQSQSDPTTGKAIPPFRLLACYTCAVPQTMGRLLATYSHIHLGTCLTWLQFRRRSYMHMHLKSHQPLPPTPQHHTLTPLDGDNLCTVHMCIQHCSNSCTRSSCGVMTSHITSIGW